MFGIILFIGIIFFFYYIINRKFGKKVEEYVRQTISANPEYLSQMDIYKADEWELKREDLILGAEIGRGTFGKVIFFNIFYLYFKGITRLWEKHRIYNG